MARAAMMATALMLLLPPVLAASAAPIKASLLCASQVVVLSPRSTSSTSLPLPSSPLRRRRADEPFFAFDPPSPSSSSEAAASSLINSMAAVVEAATDRRLFPLRAQLASRADVERACGGGGGGDNEKAVRPSPLPLVSWDPSTNRMVVRGADLKDSAAALLSVLAPLALDVARRVAHQAGGVVGGGFGGGGLAAVAAVRAAGAAAIVAAVPLWQCIACVAILGLLFPLAINAALGAAVEAACGAMALDPTSCFDLALGALFAGVVLAALSSYPIFKLCRLDRCRRTGQGMAMVV